MSADVSVSLNISSFVSLFEVHSLSSFNNDNWCKRP